MTLGKFDHAGMDGADATAAPSIDARTQYGALCWRMHRGKVEVLLITSRDTGRWVIPKGWPIAGLAPAETNADDGVSGILKNCPNVREIDSDHACKALETDSSPPASSGSQVFAH